MLKVLDLFSGIGGFSLGLERTGGFKTVAFCEIDKYCRKVLNKHWPNVPVHDDINTMEIDGYGEIDVITGGYPCQPFSVAGNRKGHSDDRHLWPRMFEIIKQARPTWIICENVNGHVTMGLDKVLFDLESEGYTSRTFIIPACAIDAPHRRDRVWIIANRKRAGIGANARAQSRAEEEREKLFEENREALSNDIDQIRATVANTKGEHDRRSDTEEARGQGKKFRKGCSSKWQPWPLEPPVGRVANGIPSRVDRIRALGNAVVPQVVTKIGLSIIGSR
jgi:DNA (cytosine-5)-methyltransferase 1